MGLHGAGVPVLLSTWLGARGGELGECSVGKEDNKKITLAEILIHAACYPWELPRTTTYQGKAMRNNLVYIIHIIHA
jgi:hypothetical protein